MSLKSQRSFFGLCQNQRNVINWQKALGNVLDKGDSILMNHVDLIENTFLWGILSDFEMS